MELWETLYQEASESAVHMPTPELDSDMRKIWILMGALSEAFYRRIGEPGFSPLEKMIRNAQKFQAESADEIAIWNELTAPHNYGAVVRYYAAKPGQEYAGGLLDEARRRWEAAQNSSPPLS